jgi:hypothetical protein
MKNYSFTVYGSYNHLLLTETLFLAEFRRLGWDLSNVSIIQGQVRIHVKGVISTDRNDNEVKTALRNYLSRFMNSLTIHEFTEVPNYNAPLNNQSRLNTLQNRLNPGSITPPNNQPTENGTYILIGLALVAVLMIRR